MNYYEHHLGDYAEATGHLSFVEDAAYSRLMRKAYATEKPLPVDKKALQRLVGARTKDEREAVDAVLAEFWTLTDEGWRNARCDAEIARFQAGEPEREIKKANEDNRMKRHREERARLFKLLTDAGLHAPWNVAMTELRELVRGATATAPETFTPPLPATAPATPATATQTPDTRHQTPEKEKAPAELAESPLRADPPPTPPFDGKNAQILNGKAVVTLAAHWELPEEWGIDAEALGWQPREVLHEAEKFRQYWTAGKGNGTRRAVKSWRQTWSNWLAKAAERKTR